MKTCLPFSKNCFKLTVTVLMMHLSFLSFSQTSSKSLLFNHGSTCGSYTGEQQFFTGGTSNNPQLISGGNVGLPYYNVLVAYNPEDHQVYYANMTSTNTYIYVADYNLNGVMTNPTLSSPTYTYNYPINQLSFDNNGDNYTFSNFNATTGTVTLDRIDIATGDEIAGTNKQVTFPASDIPNTLLDGDVVVLPNGRVFATFGNSPSKLYEINNSDGSGKGTATFLGNLPRTCFSIAYTDGNLMIAGSDGSGCYYYIWDINSLTLSPAYTYPLGKSSADMSSMTIGVGVANRLLGSNVTGYSSAVLYYEIVLKNKGNSSLNDLQLSNNLLKTFGGATINNVQVSVMSNPANLLLNSNYNGVSDTNLLMPGQVLNNFPLQQDSLVLRLQINVSNLTPAIVYNNSVLSSGRIGSGTDLLVVKDSSNDGNWSRIDIDQNGVSDDWGENVPTPFVLGTLSITSLNLTAEKKENKIHLTWQSNIEPDIIAYSIERSSDGKQFQSVALIIANNQDLYSFNDGLPKTSQQLYYRIKAQKKNESIIYSNTALIKENFRSLTTASVFPNPFTSSTKIQIYVPKNAKSDMSLLDMAGRVLWYESPALQAGTNFINLDNTEQNLKPGAYWLRINIENEQRILKIIKQ